MEDIVIRGDKDTIEKIYAELQEEMKTNNIIKALLGSEDFKVEKEDESIRIELIDPNYESAITPIYHDETEYHFDLPDLVRVFKDIGKKYPVEIKGKIELLDYCIGEIYTEFCFVPGEHNYDTLYYYGLDDGLYHVESDGTTPHPDEVFRCSECAKFFEENEGVIILEDESEFYCSQECYVESGRYDEEPGSGEFDENE